MNKTTKAFSFMFCAIGTGLFITAMLTHYWVTEILSTNYGLFDLCQPVFGCQDFGWEIDTQSDFFLPILIPRILMLIGAGLVALGILIGLVAFFTNESCPLILGGIFEILGGLVVLAACAVFTAFNYSPPTTFAGISIGPDINFHYSFYLGWASGAAFIVAGVCSIISAKSSAY